MPFDADADVATAAGRPLPDGGLPSQAQDTVATVPPADTAAPQAAKPGRPRGDPGVPAKPDTRHATAPLPQSPAAPPGSAAASPPATAVTAAAEPTTQPAHAASSPTSAPAPGQPAAPGALPPATQVSHAVAALHVGHDGSSQLTIRLDPAELGGVQVRIMRGQDGHSSVSVAVERPETLARLQTDVTHLHLALDRAGVPEQRSLVLHLASSADLGSQPASAGTAGGQGGQQNGSANAGREPHASRAASGSVEAPGGPAPDTPTPRGARLLALGIDITA